MAKKNEDIEKELLQIIDEEYSVEFEIDKIEEKVKEEARKCRRHTGEIKMFFMFKEYINFLNFQSDIPVFNLKIIAFAYKIRKSYFEILIYTASRWEQNFVLGICKTLEEYWFQEVQEEVKVQYSHIEIVNEKLYVTNYLILSEHSIQGELQFFYNNL